MKVSFNWLKQYVDLPDSVTAEELGNKLTMSTVEVEDIKKQSDSLDGIVVGEILDIKKHPNADKLSIAQINVGEDSPRQVIFGQMVEMEVGFKIPVALAPTILPGNKEIKKTKMRGETSEGMLCLDQELGLLNDGVSIQFFDKSIKNGTPIIEALELNDAVFDIDNKSMTHRPDLWGHYGLSREVAALYNKKLAQYDPPKIKEGKKRKIGVEVEDTKLCPRYMAVALNGIKVEESPQWLKKRLLSIGLRSINNIVDITNYVMYDLGQPMHAFDSQNLSGDLIKVRRATNKEKFITLDDDEHELDDRDLVIADNEKAVALAGIMGGKNSEITKNTTSIVFESANFSATNIRRSALRLDLRSDSSSRFEKSLDPINCELALRRAVQLVLELCPSAEVISNVADKSDFSLHHGPIELTWELLWKKIGVELKEKEVIKILESLGFELKEKKEGLSVIVPSWRATKDISIAEDLVEEISRIYGYDNIDRILPSFPIIPPEQNTLRILERKALDLFVQNLNYTESYNYSFVSEKQIANINDDRGQYIELDNPISKEKPYLRRDLLLNLLENIAKNIEFFETVKLVEIGKVFRTEEMGQKVDKKGDEMLPRQDTYLTSVFASKKDDNPFNSARAALESISRSFNISFELTSDKSRAWEHPSRSAHVLVGDSNIGNIFELHPQATTKNGLGVRVGVVEINLNRLLEVVTINSLKYTKISEYPVILRDLAVIVRDDIKFSDLVEKIQSIDPILQKVELFDVYQGKNIGEGYKSIAFHLIYGSYQQTLESNMVDAVQEKIMKILEKEFDASIRK